MTAPSQPPLVVEVTYFARRLGLAVPIDDDQVAFLLEEAIRDRMSDAEAYLGLPITPTQTSDTGRWPHTDGWLLTREPVVEVLTAVAETDTVTGAPTGTYTVTYTWGLDAVSDPELRPIRRWVVAHAANTPEIRRLVRSSDIAGTRFTQSVSAEGQSISYGDDLSVGPTSGGTELSVAMLDGRSLPTLATLDRWRRANRRVYQRPGRRHHGGWLGDVLASDPVF